MVLAEEARWVGGFPDHGTPAKGDLTEVKPRTPPKGEGPFSGVVERQVDRGEQRWHVSMCRKCLAGRLGFAPDPETPEESDPKKPPPLNRFGHEDPV